MSAQVTETAHGSLGLAVDDLLGMHRTMVTARLIDGKAAALSIRERVGSLVPEFERRTGRAPGLATVLVGEDPASAVYVRSKNRSTAEAGMVSFAHNLPDTTSEDELLQLVIALNADERVESHRRSPRK